MVKYPVFSVAELKSESKARLMRRLEQYENSGRYSDALDEAIRLSREGLVEGTVQVRPGGVYKRVGSPVSGWTRVFD